MLKTEANCDCEGMESWFDPLDPRSCRRCVSSSPKIGLQEKGLIQDVQNFAKRNLILEKEAHVQAVIHKAVGNLTERYPEHP